MAFQLGTNRAKRITLELKLGYNAGNTHSHALSHTHVCMYIWRYNTQCRPATVCKFSIIHKSLKRLYDRLLITPGSIFNIIKVYSAGLEIINVTITHFFMSALSCVWYRNTHFLIFQSKTFTFSHRLC